MRLSKTTLFSLLSFICSTYAQTETGSAASAVASPDGLIVPFTSGLPACASLCGPLFDVQGACTPPNIASTDDNCFCTDSRLSAFDTDAGVTGVSAVCGPASCNAQTDLQAIKTWFDNFCNTKKVVTTTAAGGAVSTSTGSSQNSSGGGGNTWLDTHYKWVIMLILMVVFIVGGWVAASLLRKRYIRKKEKEIEMRPPVAWGPHQLQGTTGGYGYGDGVADANKGGRKEMGGAVVTPADATKGKRESKGWLTKHRH